MGGRAGKGTGFGASVQMPRLNIQKGSKEYQQAQMAANDIFGAASFNKQDYAENEARLKMMGTGLTPKVTKTDYEGWQKEWDKEHKFLQKALKHVQKKGNDFEKSVATSISKTMRKSNEQAKQVAFVSSKQAWVIGKALVETHYKN